MMLWSFFTSSDFVFVCFLLLHVKIFWKMANSSRFHDSKELEKNILKTRHTTKLLASAQIPGYT